MSDITEFSELKSCPKCNSRDNLISEEFKEFKNGIKSMGWLVGCSLLVARGFGITIVRPEKEEAIRIGIPVPQTLA